MGALLSEAEKGKWAAIAVELNKIIKDERDAVLDHVSALPKESHLVSSDSRLYVDGNGYFPNLHTVRTVGCLIRGLQMDTSFRMPLIFLNGEILPGPFFR